MTSVSQPGGQLQRHLFSQERAKKVIHSHQVPQIQRSSTMEVFGALSQEVGHCGKEGALSEEPQPMGRVSNRRVQLERPLSQKAVINNEITSIQLSIEEIQKDRFLMEALLCEDEEVGSLSRSIEEQNKNCAELQMQEEQDNTQLKVETKNQELFLKKISDVEALCNELHSSSSLRGTKVNECLELKDYIKEIKNGFETVLASERELWKERKLLFDSKIDKLNNFLTSFESDKQTALLIEKEEQEELKKPVKAEDQLIRDLQPQLSQNEAAIRESTLVINYYLQPQVDSTEQGEVPIAVRERLLVETPVLRRMEEGTLTKDAATQQHGTGAEDNAEIASLKRYHSSSKEEMKQKIDEITEINSDFNTRWREKMREAEELTTKIADEKESNNNLVIQITEISLDTDTICEAYIESEQKIDQCEKLIKTIESQLLGLQEELAEKADIGLKNAAIRVENDALELKNILLKQEVDVLHVQKVASKEESDGMALEVSTSKDIVERLQDRHVNLLSMQSELQEELLVDMKQKVTHALCESESTRSKMNQELKEAQNVIKRYKVENTESQSTLTLIREEEEMLEKELLTVTEDKESHEKLSKVLQEDRRAEKERSDRMLEELEQSHTMGQERLNVAKDKFKILESIKLENNKLQQELIQQARENEEEVTALKESMDMALKDAVAAFEATKETLSNALKIKDIEMADARSILMEETKYNEALIERAKKTKVSINKAHMSKSQHKKLVLAMKDKLDRAVNLARKMKDKLSQVSDSSNQDGCNMESIDQVSAAKPAKRAQERATKTLQKRFFKNTSEEWHAEKSTKEADVCYDFSDI